MVHCQYFIDEQPNNRYCQMIFTQAFAPPIFCFFVLHEFVKIPLNFQLFMFFIMKVHNNKLQSVQSADRR